MNLVEGGVDQHDMDVFSARTAEEEVLAMIERKRSNFRKGEMVWYLFLKFPWNLYPKDPDSTPSATGEKPLLVRVGELRSSNIIHELGRLKKPAVSSTNWWNGTDATKTIAIVRTDTTSVTLTYQTIGGIIILPHLNMKRGLRPFPEAKRRYWTLQPNYYGTGIINRGGGGH